MHSTDLQVLDAALHWSAAGQRFALITIARTWGSAPRPAGAWLALRADGLVAGSVSGGCVEDDLVTRMRAGELNGNAPFTLVYGVTQEEAASFGLPCGGTLELVVEPAPEVALLQQLADHLQARRLAARHIDLTNGRVTLHAAGREQALHWDGRILTTVHGPQWRLLLIGANQIARFLAPMAQALDYELVVCDPREEYCGSWDVPHTRLLRVMPDEAVLTLGADARTAVVALTHDPKLDDMALLEALKSPAFYVGALGSRANNQRRRDRLLQHFDLASDEVGRLHGPVGLPIGSRTPPEIAVSILAELTAVKNRTRPVHPG